MHANRHGGLLNACEVFWLACEHEHALSACSRHSRVCMTCDALSVLITTPMWIRAGWQDKPVASHVERRRSFSKELKTLTARRHCCVDSGQTNGRDPDHAHSKRRRHRRAGGPNDVRGILQKVRSGGADAGGRA